jgi:hypothetical protein
MFKSKFARQTLAFVLMVLASALFYPAAQYGWNPAIWILLALIAAANLLTLLIA